MLHLWYDGWSSLIDWKLIAEFFYNSLWLFDFCQRSLTSDPSHPQFSCFPVQQTRWWASVYVLVEEHERICVPVRFQVLQQHSSNCLLFSAILLIIETRKKNLFVGLCVVCSVIWRSASSLKRKAWIIGDYISGRVNNSGCHFLFETLLRTLEKPKYSTSTCVFEFKICRWCGVVSLCSGQR